MSRLRLLTALLVLAWAGVALAQDPSLERPQHSDEAVERMQGARDELPGAERNRGIYEGWRDGLAQTLATLEQDYEVMQATYADASAPPLDAAEVRARMLALAEAIEDGEDARLVESRDAERARVGQRLESARQRSITLDERYFAWERAAQERMAPEEWNGQDELWDQLASEHRAAVAELLNARQETADLLNECRTLRHQIRARRIATQVLLGRENLLMRGKSAVTIAAVTQGVRDVRLLPTWFQQELSEAVGYVRDKANLQELALVLALCILVVGALLFVRRRLRRRIRKPADVDGDGERSLDLLRWIGSGVLTALAIAAAPLFVGTLVSGLSAGAARTWVFVGLLAGSLFFVRRMSRLLLPDGDTWTPLELDATSVTYIRAGIRLLLYGTLVLVPLALALRELGYQNQGARQAIWLLYKLFVVAVTLLFLLRKPVIDALTTRSRKPFGRAMRWALAVLRPVLVIAGPMLLALDLLEYDLLATFLVRVMGGVLGGALAAVLLYRVAWRGLAAWIQTVIEEPKDEAAGDGPTTVGAALKIANHVTVIAVIVIGVLVMFLIQGGNLESTREFLDAELPFQGQTEGRKITWWGVILGTTLLLLFLTSVSKIKLFLERFVLPRTSLDAALRYTISTLIGYVFVAIGLYAGLVQMFDLSAIGYVFAALSVGIGFGLQEIVSNFISGLILLFERPIKVGDIITVGTTEGVVQKINIRATRIQTHDNVSLLIPNKDFITQPVVNAVYADTVIRIRIPVGVAYGSDTALVKRLLEELGTNHPARLKRRAPEALFLAFGPSSLDFELRIWLPEVADRFRVASELRFAIDAAFREHGIEIPFSQHDLHLRSVDASAAQALRGNAPDEPGTGLDTDSDADNEG
jgi:small-conductance mechanosensitive channel